MKRFLPILFSTLVVLVAYFAIQLSQQHSLKSPILGVSRINLANNVWLPQGITQAFGGEKEPAIGAKSAFFVDTKTGQIMYQKNPQQKLPIASLVKIMTVIVALENHKLTDSFYISDRAAGMEPDKMLLIGGETLSLEELLDGVFLVSANDAAEAIAEESVGGRDEFIELMNKEAVQIGMKDTKFINPTGLEEDGVEQYSTALDVALMGRYAIKHWPEIVNISSQPHILIPKTETHQDYDLYSGINLVTTYPGVVGLKTGYTPEAGLTLITLARREGHEVLGVLLGSENRREEARELLDYSFKKLGVEIFHP
jgi:serine-type D-Ala-D-Ala carboxypeptidase (penicillin-binding protein 5/6)